MFAYIGFAGFKFVTKDMPLGFILLTIAFCFVSRFVMIFALGILKMLRKRELLWNWKDNALLWMGGCKRGAVAMALIASMPNGKEDELES
jgi:NhaP-type Na+/H+ or K+/H+ antiporter